MNLFNPEELDREGRRLGLAPSKRYGQNFLIDETVIAKIVEAANITSGDTIVEVGPGFGVLTLALVEKAQKVFAFEIEKKLQPYWDKTIADRKIENLEIVWGNVLNEFGNATTAQPYKVVANLPYQITSPIIRLFLENANPPSEMVVMVQKEVGERLSAKPGDLSILGITAQYYARIDYLFTVVRTAFWPSPKVDSAVVRLALRPAETQHDNAEKIFRLVKAGFSQPRKKLINNLKPVLTDATKPLVADKLAELGFTPTVRAQELSLEHWKALLAIVDAPV